MKFIQPNKIQANKIDVVKLFTYNFSVNTNPQQPNQNQLNINQPLGYISLPYDDKQFAEFLVNLLGRPQTLEERIYGVFNIKMNEIINLYDSLDRRIQQQNNGQLTQFSATIHFKKTSKASNYEKSITLNNFHELVNYNETRPLISESISLSWTYLIHFNGKTTPEEQKIDVFIGTNGNLLEDSHNTLANLEVLRTYGIFKLTVKCTARTWGVDIIELLTREVIDFTKIKNLFVKIFQKIYFTFIIVSSILYGYGTLIFLRKIKSDLISEELSGIKKIIIQNNSTEDLLNLVITYVIKYSAFTIENDILRYGLLSFLFWFTLTFVLLLFNLISFPSFLVFTSIDNKLKQKASNINKLKIIFTYLSFPVTFIINITLGLFLLQKN